MHEEQPTICIPTICINMDSYSSRREDNDWEQNKSINHINDLLSIVGNDHEFQIIIIPIF